jgi:hypothetical protein
MEKSHQDDKTQDFFSDGEEGAQGGFQNSVPQTEVCL